MSPWILALSLLGPPDEVPVQRPSARAPAGPTPTTSPVTPAPEPTPAPPEDAASPPVEAAPAAEPPPEPGPAADPTAATTAPPIGDPSVAPAPEPRPSAAADTEPPAPRRKGTGLLIAAGGVTTGAIVGRTLFGLVLYNEINQTTPDRAPRIYAIGALVSLPAGAALALGAVSRTLAARHDLHRDIYVRHLGPRPKSAFVIAGWTLFGVGMAGWLGTRIAAPAVARQCPRGECFVVYMETSWHASTALSSAGAMLGSYGTHYTRLARRHATTGQLVVAPFWDGHARGLSLAGTF